MVGKGPVPIPSPKTPLGEQGRPPALQLFHPAPNFQVAEGTWICDQHPQEGWGQLSRLWQLSQLPSRKMGAGEWRVVECCSCLLAPSTPQDPPLTCPGWVFGPGWRRCG